MREIKELHYAPASQKEVKRFNGKIKSAKQLLSAMKNKDRK